MASQCCSYNDGGNCTADCGMNREGNSTFHCVCSDFWTGDNCTVGMLHCQYVYNYKAQAAYSMLKVAINNHRLIFKFYHVGRPPTFLSTLSVKSSC